MARFEISDTEQLDLFELQANTPIDAPPELVWKILLDFPSYPRWNPFIRSIEGTPSTGTTLTVQLQLPGGGPTKMRPKVLRVLAGREFRWKGNLLFPGIFDGEHWFMVYPLAADKVRFVQGEKFSGLLSFIIAPMIRKKTLQGFRNMNLALREHAERTYSESSGSV